MGWKCTIPVGHTYSDCFMNFALGKELFNEHIVLPYVGVKWTRRSEKDKSWQQGKTSRSAEHAWSHIEIEMYMNSHVRLPSKLLQKRDSCKEKREAIRREIKNLWLLVGPSWVRSEGQMNGQGSSDVGRCKGEAVEVSHVVVRTWAWVDDYHLPSTCPGSAWPHWSIVRTKSWVLVRSAKSWVLVRSAILRIRNPDQL